MTKTIKTRIKLLKDMHKYIINEIGDEEAYFTWITVGVPDEPQEEDFEYIAENDSEWNDVVDTFKHICYNYR